MRNTLKTWTRSEQQRYKKTLGINEIKKQTGKVNRRNMSIQFTKKEIKSVKKNVKTFSISLMTKNMKTTTMRKNFKLMRL